MRSNDLVWGFSGINSFEWSLLQEMLAFWLGAEVGELHFYVGSLHLYERHYERARRIVAGPGVVSSPAMTPSRFATPFAHLDEQLDHWFAFEGAARTGSLDADRLLERISDPLLRDYALMVAASWRYARDGSDAGRTALAEVSDDALRVAGTAVFDWREGREAEGDTTIDPHEVRGAILALHRAKDAVYGDSWKRRGERGSILPNIARKLDRFREYFPTSATPGDETWFDTAVDLLVYAVKYRAYLIDQTQPAGSGTLSDGPDGVDALLPVLDNRSTERFEQLLDAANVALEQLEQLVDADAPNAAKISCVLELIDEAANLTMHLAEESPWRTRATLRRWVALP
jgi:thymidylate synthase